MLLNQEFPSTILGAESGYHFFTQLLQANSKIILKLEKPDNSVSFPINLSVQDYFCLVVTPCSLVIKYYFSLNMEAGYDLREYIWSHPRVEITLYSQT
jgi:hypothetical protein